MSGCGCRPNDGRNDAHYDFNNVGTDYAHEIVDGADYGDGSCGTRARAKRLFAAFAAENGPDILETARESYEDASGCANPAHAARYADTYVAEYLRLIEALTMDLARQRVAKRAADRAADRSFARFSHLAAHGRI